jgi:dolichyl-phosphate-mannose--protein O-mannosyl transferase
LKENSHHKEVFYENIQLLLNEIIRVIIHPVSLLQIEKIQIDERKGKEKEKMSTEKEAKLKALQLTLDKLDKTYGKGTVMKMGIKPLSKWKLFLQGL